MSKKQFHERDCPALQEALRNSSIMLSLHFSPKENPQYFQFKYYFLFTLRKTNL